MSGSVGGSLPCKKTSLASSRRYRASNFTDVTVNTISNMSGMRRSAANKLPHKRNNIPIYAYAAEMKYTYAQDYYTMTRERGEDKLPVTTQTSLTTAMPGLSPD